MATARDIPTDLALEIEEDLDPERFIGVAREFFALIGEIERATGEEPPSWRVKVREGSNILALAPNPDMSVEAASLSIAATKQAVQALVYHDPKLLDFPDTVLDRAMKLSDMSKGSVSLRIWIQHEPLSFGPDIGGYIREESRATYSDYGSVEGTLSAIQDGRGGLEIRVKDPLWRRPIKCFLPERMLDDAIGHFRRRVELFGTIRYRKDDTPDSIRVDRLEPMPDDSDLPSINEMQGLFGRSDMVAE